MPTQQNAAMAEETSAVSWPVSAPSTKPVRVASTKPSVTPQPLKKAAGSDVQWQEF